ncbi:exopolyphosphatase [Trichloromonas sp.]|uniref:Ppx/GppA phosphatase family protein n=1 Tax=Trichloromonas sp. TaxID=3069249 RepID=UPI002A46A331|nr:Ppx/GppA phosphatase family protein [Trichloromonas sp.]
MFAAIDIGTNTVRMLLAEVGLQGLTPCCYERRITRLGGGLCPIKGLAPDARERTLCALRDMVATMAAHDVQRLRAVGTQALRLATNGTDFVHAIRHELGIAVEIISGDEEARLSALGVREALRPQPPSCLIFDIGGGSTEFILLERNQRRFARSYPLGVVRLAESSEETDQVIDDILDRLEKDLHDVKTSVTDTTALVGTAGTVTTIAALDLEMTDYDWRRVNNHRVSRERVEYFLYRLRSMSVSERENLPGMEKGRGDLIVPGLSIVSGLLARFRKAEIIVSDFGLLEGIVLDLAAAPAN